MYFTLYFNSYPKCAASTWRLPYLNTTIKNTKSFADWSLRFLNSFTSRDDLSLGLQLISKSIISQQLIDCHIRGTSAPSKSKLFMKIRESLLLLIQFLTLNRAQIFINIFSKARNGTQTSSRWIRFVHVHTGIIFTVHLMHYPLSGICNRYLPHTNLYYVPKLLVCWLRWCNSCNPGRVMRISTDPYSGCNSFSTQD